MAYTQFFNLFASFVSTPEAQRVHHLFHAYQDLVKAYNSIQHLPVHIRLAWLGVLGVVALLHFDMKIAVAAGQPDAPYPPAAIRPVRIFIRRVVVGLIALVMANLFGPQSALGVLLVFLIMTRYYFLSGGLLILAVFIITIFELEM